MRRTESLLPFQTITSSSSQGSRQFLADIIYVDLAKNEKITKNLIKSSKNHQMRIYLCFK